MVFSIDLRRIERQSYRVIRQDGLSDICGGLMLGIMAVFFIDFRYAGALILGCAMQTIVLPICRRKITYPRVGYVRFPGRTDKVTLIVWDILVPLLVISLIVCVGVWAKALLPVCLGVFLALLALAGARVTRYVLDYLLVGLFVASGITGQLPIWLGCEPTAAAAFQLWSLSGVLIGVGFVQLIRFLHKHPKPAMEITCDHEN
jgi:hypothetical protein